MFYVFDLDGTLADCQHRVPLAQAKDWRGFFAACVDDKPILPVINLFQQLHKNVNHTVEIWSGRSDEVREQSMDWLERHKMPGVMLTHMRKAGDHRPDDIVKAGFLDPKRLPDIIFDDRKRVVDMWRARGLTCFQVADGDF